MSDRARSDYARLTDDEIALFRKAVFEINDADDRRRTKTQRNLPTTWPKKLRIKPIEGARGVYEMTWNFSGPDGRATFEFVSIDAEPAIRWRRIGSHRILEEP